MGVSGGGIGVMKWRRNQKPMWQPMKLAEMAEMAKAAQLNFCLNGWLWQSQLWRGFQLCRLGIVSLFVSAVMAVEKISAAYRRWLHGSVILSGNHPKLAFGNGAVASS